MMDEMPLEQRFAGIARLQRVHLWLESYLVLVVDYCTLLGIRFKGPSPSVRSLVDPVLLSYRWLTHTVHPTIHTHTFL